MVYAPLTELLNAEELVRYQKAIEHILEGEVYLKELRKMYSNLKAQQKKYFKMLTDEEKTSYQYGSSIIWVIRGNLQLAENKNKLIEKEIKSFRYYVTLFNQTYKKLIRTSAKDTNMLTHYITHLLRYSSSLHCCINNASEEIRIANKHLDKTTKHIKYVKKLGLYKRL